MKQLTKKDIVEFLYKEEITATKKDANAIVTILQQFFTDVLRTAKDNDEDLAITLKWFGTFFTYVKPEQTRVNPISKERMVIPAHRIIKFRKGKDLK